MSKNLFTKELHQKTSHLHLVTKVREEVEKPFLEKLERTQQLGQLLLTEVRSL